MTDVLLSRRLHRPPRYLPIILMFVTNRCNLRCKMCGVCEHRAPDDGSPPRNMNELSTDEWKAVLDSAAKLRTTMISITGGEPLLRADIFELIRYGRQRGISVHMCSNGVLLDEERARKLGEAGLNALSVSIESPEKDIHELLRGKNTFERTVNSVRLVREHAPDVQLGINYLITTANYKNMTEMIPFAESLGVRQLKFAPIHTNLLHRDMRIDQYGHLIFTKESLDELEGEVRRLIGAVRKSRLLTTSTMFLSGITSLYSEPRRFRCYAGYAACAIDPGGYVAPCCDMEGTLSVRDMPLEQIWRSKQFHALRKRVDRCNSSCWDTTNTEISLRLRPSSILRDVAKTWRDVRFYYGGQRD